MDFDELKRQMERVNEDTIAGIREVRDEMKRGFARQVAEMDQGMTRLEDLLTSHQRNAGVVWGAVFTRINEIYADVQALKREQAQMNSRLDGLDKAG